MQSAKPARVDPYAFGGYQAPAVPADSTIGDAWRCRSSGQPAQRWCLGRTGLWGVGGLAMVLSVAANVGVRCIGVQLFDVSAAYAHLRWDDFVPVTVVAVAAAMLVFALVASVCARPLSVYLPIAMVALLVSFLPDLGELSEHHPGASLAAVLTLVAMHVIDAIICVGALAYWQAQAKPGRRRVRRA